MKRAFRRDCSRQEEAESRKYDCKYSLPQLLLRARCRHRQDKGALLADLELCRFLDTSCILQSFGGNQAGALLTGASNTCLRCYCKACRARQPQTRPMTCILLLSGADDLFLAQSSPAGVKVGQYFHLALILMKFAVLLALTASGAAFCHCC